MDQDPNHPPESGHGNKTLSRASYDARAGDVRRHARARDVRVVRSFPTAARLPADTDDREAGGRREAPPVAANRQSLDVPDVPQARPGEDIGPNAMGLIPSLEFALYAVELLEDHAWPSRCPPS